VARLWCCGWRGIRVDCEDLIEDVLDVFDGDVATGGSGGGSG